MIDIINHNGYNAILQCYIERCFSGSVTFGLCGVYPAGVVGLHDVMRWLVNPRFIKNPRAADDNFLGFGVAILNQPGFVELELTPCR